MSTSLIDGESNQATLATPIIADTGADHEGVTAAVKQARAKRLRDYREAINGRRNALILAVIPIELIGGAVFIFLCMAPSMLGLQTRLLVTLAVTIATLASGDIYELFRDWLEIKLFRPRYDRASHKPPALTNGLSPAHAIVLYMLGAPLLPMLVIWVLSKLELVQFAQGLSSWSAAAAIALVSGWLRWQNYPTSFRGLFRLCKRIPGADLNDE